MGKPAIRYFQLSSKDFVYLKSILEAYEGHATLSTVDAPNGIVRLSVAKDFITDVDTIMIEIGKEICLSEFPASFSPSVATLPARNGNSAHA